MKHARSFGWRGVVGLAPLVLAGCLSDRPDPNRPDPLTGLPRRAPGAARPTPSTYSPERAESGILASAGGVRDGVSGLGIQNDRAPVGPGGSSPAANTWSGTDSQSNAGPTPGARLGGTSAAENVAGGSAPGFGGAVRIRDFADAQRFLAAHGVKWQKLETIGEGEWKFSCSVPTKANATTMRTYEATDKYGLLAMQKVIDKIVLDRAQ